jgi:glycosyltransferase involved in cell wall biosynthesis
MLYVRDEADVLPWNLTWYARLGIPTVVVDNGSTDGTSEILERAAADGTVVALRRIETAEHDLPLLLDAVLELALAQEPDALVLAAADEFFEVADGSDLVAAMTEDFEGGFNALKFANMEFVMTPADSPNVQNPVERMRHYSFRRIGIIRAYRSIPGLVLAEGMSHRPTLPDGASLEIAPRKYVSRHYPLRSLEQLERKLERIHPTRANPNASTHYLHLIGNEEGAIVDPAEVARYDEDHDWDYTRHLRRVRGRELQKALTRLYLDHEDLKAENASLRERCRELEADG